jgi:hypothetical protein
MCLVMFIQVQEVQTICYNGQQWQMARVEWGERSSAMQWCRELQVRSPAWVPLEWLVASDAQSRRLIGRGLHS